MLKCLFQSCQTKVAIRRVGYFPTQQVTAVPVDDYAFPNEDACLRLVTTILMEISEEWETARCCLKFDP